MKGNKEVFGEIEGKEEELMMTEDKEETIDPEEISEASTIGEILVIEEIMIEGEISCFAFQQTGKKAMTVDIKEDEEVLAEIEDQEDGISLMIEEEEGQEE